MNVVDFCLMEEAAWSAFYSVLKAHGFTDHQVKLFRQVADREDLFNDASDCLWKVIGEDDE